MTDVLFVNPSIPFLESNDLTADAPPLGLLSLATYLQKNGLKAKIIDGATHATNKEFFSSLEKELASANFVGVTFQIGMQGVVKQITEFIETNFPDKKIVFGGWQPTINPQTQKKTNLFFISGVNGEAYAKLFEIITGKKPFSQTLETPINYSISDFGLDWSHYLYPNHKLGKIKKLQLEFSREFSIGIENLERETRRFHIAVYASHTCPAYLAHKGCTFCDIAKEICLENLPPKIAANRKKLFREIENLSPLFKGKKITLEFNAEATSFSLWKQLAKKFRSARLNLHQFCFQTRPDMLSDSWIAELKNSQFENIVQIGFEYGNQRELDSVNKGTSFKSYKTLLPKLKEIKIAGFFILTSNISTLETLKQNISFIENAISLRIQTLVNPMLIESSLPENSSLFSPPKFQIPNFSEQEKEEIITFLRQKISEHENAFAEHTDDNWLSRSYYSLASAEHELLTHLNIINQTQLCSAPNWQLR
ncbi:MAG: cobalamin-dependent protein [Candidatus Diapherotrites archaeon]|nr:cobalamin-dependent protein [Candidatus Diapherotrites archaeon]